MKYMGSAHSPFKLQERNALTKTQTVRCIRCGWTTILHATRMEKYLKSCKTEEAEEQDAEEEEAPSKAGPINLSLDVSLCSQPEAAEHTKAATGEQREIWSPADSSQNRPPPPKAPTRTQSLRVACLASRKPPHPVGLRLKKGSAPSAPTETGVFQLPTQHGR